MIYAWEQYAKYALCLMGGAMGYLVSHHLYQSTAFHQEAPIRWSWLPFLGWAIEFGKRPLSFLLECREQYDDIFGLVIGGNRMFFITEPFSTNVIIRPCKDLHWEEFHHEILQNFFNVKSQTLKSKCVDEDLMRKYYSTYLLSDKHLHHLTVRMLHQLDRSSIKLHDGEQMLYGFLSKLIFRASVASIFNESRCEEEGLYEAFHTWDSHMAMAAGGMSLNYFPKAAKARDLLTNMCAQHSDDLSEFMLARWKYFSELEKEGKMLKGEQEKEHLAIFWASLANTMPATFWILYYLMHHEQALKDVLTEVHKVFPSPDHEISQEDMNQMTFTDAVITEALRLSTGSLIMRIVRNPVTLTLANGKAYRFRKGDRVGLCPPVFHYDEDFFPKAKEFNPYRWMTGDTPEERVSASLGKMPLKKDGKEISSGNIFLPFGAGVTYCPGRRFARNEVKLLIIYLLSRFEFQWLEGKDYKAEIDGSRAGLGIFPPKTDAKVHIKKI